MDVPDMGVFQAAMQSENAAKAMAYDGVLPETLAMLIKVSSASPRRCPARWAPSSRTR